MIKAIFLMFDPTAWDRLAQARRGVGFILAAYLLPLLVVISAVEGVALVHWGKWQSGVGVIKKFTTDGATLYEVAQLLLTLAVVFVCAHLVKILGETFHDRHTYTQAFTVVAYTLCPVFLLRLLDVFPMMNPWVPWTIGIVLSLWIYYQGLPRVMKPDPSHAFELYVISSMILFATTGLVRTLTALCLRGQVDFEHSYLGMKLLHLLARLHS
ncbi:MAG TPA: Yip1 family protein [Verrucomicrobiae bacterium]|nr:Yip1 family protein [Verrucomicrobiae bacterium]